jgi:hypothetical protein
MADGDALVELATVARREGRLKDCADLYVQAADAFDSNGELMRGAHARRHVADVLVGAGDACAARAIILRVLEFYRTREVGRLELANTLRVAGLAEEGCGGRDVARLIWTEARDLYAAEGIDAAVAECDRRLKVLGGE